MYAVDFLAVENEDFDSTKSGDAIAMQFQIPGETRPRIVVIDGGYTATGQSLVDHILKYYATSHVDLVISTHPDVDHINGLQTVLEQCTVGELMMHLPWVHRADAGEISNYEAIRSLYELAVSKGIPVTEPFTGVERFGAAIRIMGPSEVRYTQLLGSMVEAERSGLEAIRRSQARGGGVLAATRLLKRVLAMFPIETLGDDDDPSPRNQSSAITLLELGEKRLMFTGDAGIESLNAAADYYESTLGPFGSTPLSFFQAPHHGSKHNLGRSVLNRLFGTPGQSFSEFTAFISSAKASEKHPSPKVTNALGRRAGTVCATEGRTICYGTWSSRPGWSSINPVGPLEEDDV